ncbi:hypothetical protein H7J86_26445 [Mycobacterium hackensackense]|uniref:hypothetical protein n=1 Tax=Mycobacterium hackensackense TaxID=228909 RepID=UPI002265C882|nr:hypothetical protein [Mycobacterium hackensackense]MCV7255710.1 hypothetical protein [Mycobacterium hackensackense]
MSWRRTPTGLGQQSQQYSLPVALAAEQVQDVQYTGPAGLTASNNILVAGGAAIDTMAGAGLPTYRSFYVQVTGTAGITAGAIVFEGSNDGVTNWVVLPYVDGAAATGNATAAGVTIAAGTTRFLQGAIPYRYFRVRISTAFTGAGGSISAIATLSPAPYVWPIVQVGQPTPANLNATAQLAPRGSGGNSAFSAAVTNAAAAIKAGPGQIYAYELHNPNAAIAYVGFFNKAAAGVVLGTDVPLFTIPVPANQRIGLPLDVGVAFGTAVSVAATTARGGAVALASAVDVTVFYT